MVFTVFKVRGLLDKKELLFVFHSLWNSLGLLYFAYILLGEFGFEKITSLASDSGSCICWRMELLY